jgi:broad specificity phosphatase PhoE
LPICNLQTISLRIKAMTTVLLIRHGMTDAVGQRIVGWTPGVLLNPEGMRQVEALSRELRRVKLDAVVSSPLERAAITAMTIADPHSIAVTHRDGLGEVRFGDWTGKTLNELADDERWQRWNALRSCGRAPGGESMLDTQRRMFDELTRVREEYPDGTVALVSHADAIRALLVYVLGMSMDVFLRLRIDPASVSILRMSEWNLEVAGVNLHADGIAAQLRPGLLAEH